MYPAAAAAAAAAVYRCFGGRSRRRTRSSGRAMLRARQYVFHPLLLVPDPPSLAPCAAPPDAPVSPPPAAVPPPGSDRTYGARRCAPADAAGGSRAGAGGAEPRCCRDEPGPGPGPGAGAGHAAEAGQLSALQLEPGAGVPAAGHRRPGVLVPVRVSGRGGAGSVRRPRLPAEPRGAATGGLHGVVLGDPVPQRLRSRRTAPHAGKSLITTPGPLAARALPGLTSGPHLSLV